VHERAFQIAVVEGDDVVQVLEMLFDVDDVHQLFSIIIEIDEND